MQAEDWEYIREGGKHAIFAYRPTDKSRTKWVGRLLRIKKETLKHSVVMCDHKVECPKTSVLDCSHDFRVMICHKLKPYADLPTVVCLEWIFLKALRDRTLKRAQIPSIRKKDWYPGNNNKFAVCKEPPTGMILWDYRQYSFLFRNHVNDKPMTTACFSVEIKPKAGYRAFSPFVNSSRTAKFLHSRFVLQQKLYCEGLLTREWMGKASKADVASHYDPLDLFSGDDRKIKNAICNLFTCPQNNLQISIGNDLVFGANCDLLLDKLAPLINSDDTTTPHRMDEGNTISFLAELISKVLHREGCLKKLLRLQKLDILDADGAISVYDQLVRLCNGSQDLAESLIDKTPIAPTQLLIPPHLLLADCPFISPKDASVIQKICDEVALFQKCLDSAPLESVIDRPRDDAQFLISLLQPEDCRYLLQTWLLSLAMCDVSLFISFMVYKNQKSVDNHREADNMQQDSTPGILKLADFKIQYCIKIIDYDQKPGRKLRERIKKEKAFDTIVV